MDVGDWRAGQAHDAYEGHGWGGRRPWGARGRGRRSRRARRELEGGARRYPGRDPLKGLEPGEAVLRPALRRDGAGRFAASGAFDRHPAAGRSARYRHCRSDPARPRLEEHTSELQSLMRISYAVFCMKKKNTIITNITILYTITIHPPFNTVNHTPNL